MILCSDEQNSIIAPNDSVNNRGATVGRTIVDYDNLEQTIGL